MCKTLHKSAWEVYKKSYDTLKEEASTLASELEDITYAWSRDVTNKYGLLADIIGLDSYDNMTGINTYAVPPKPPTYDAATTNVTPTHMHKCIEEEWKLVQVLWFIHKGFLLGVVDNLQDALDEQYYAQLKHCLTHTITSPIS